MKNENYRIHMGTSGTTESGCIWDQNHSSLYMSSIISRWKNIVMYFKILENNLTLENECIKFSLCSLASIIHNLVKSQRLYHANSGEYTSLIIISLISILIRGQFPFFMCVCVCVCGVSHSVMFESETPQTVTWKLLCPWNSPGKNTGADYSLLQGDLPDSGIKPGSPALPVYSFTRSFITGWMLKLLPPFDYCE